VSKKLRDVLKILNIYDRIVIGVNKHTLITYENKICIDDKYLDCEVDCVGTTKINNTPCLLVDICEWIVNFNRVKENYEFRR